MIDIPEMLMIGGVGQNVGKTSLACNIIAHYYRKNQIIGIKVTPHFHKSTGDADVISEGAGWQLLEEKSLMSKKDTARMLKAGAEKAFLLQSEIEGLEQGIQEFLKIIPENCSIICESAGLNKIVKPGIFIALRQLNCKVCSIDDEKLFQDADRIVTFTGNSFDFSLAELKLLNNQWVIDTYRND